MRTLKPLKNTNILAIDGSLTDLPNNKNLMKEFGGIKMKPQQIHQTTENPKRIFIIAKITDF